jgi:catechol 2,3-dioxygenase-like lactoylglutathione lyase family enzyme
MSMTEARSDESGIASVTNVDLKLEVVVIPVSDVDRAMEFYGGLGWRLDADFLFDNGFRVVQFTPPGSGCSVQFGTNITSAAPGSADGLYLIVSDIEAAREELAARGVDVSEVFYPGMPGAQFQTDATSGRSRGVRRITPATVPSPRSATRTATAGCCRRSLHGCRDGSTPPRPRSHPLRIWRVRFGVQRPRTAGTRSASGEVMRTGPTGTPHTWWRSRRGRSCRGERL